MLRRYTIASLLFLIVLYFHATSRVIVSTDSMWSVYLAQSLVKDGDLILDEYRPLAKERKNYGLRKRKGHLYSYFPAGTALMATPFVWAYNFLPVSIAEMLPGFPKDKSSEDYSAENINLPLQKIIASIFTAACVSIIFLLATNTLTTPWAIFVALTAAFCSPLWSTASRGLWQHGPSALLIALSLLLLTKIKLRPVYAGLSGALLAFSYIVRPTNAIALVCFGIFIAFNNKQAFRIYILSALIVFVPFVAVSYDFFNRFLPPYYNANRLRLGWHFPQALVANLLSPNRGLFLLSPIFLPALIPLWKTFASLKLNTLEFAVLTAFCGHLFAISFFPEWWGGHAFGARYMTETIPYVIFFFIIWLKNVESKLPVYIFLAISSMLSFYIHYQGATNIKTFMWNVQPVNIDKDPSRVWDVSDLQFMR